MIRLVLSRPGEARHVGEMRRPPAGGVHGPLVSCLMVSRGDRPAVAQAIDCYRRQSYANRELVILCDRPDNLVAPIVAGLDDPTIRYHLVEPAVLGTLRNQSVALARGELLCQWDDDDLFHPDRLDLQVAALADGHAVASFLLRWTIWWPGRRRLAFSSQRFWEGSLLVRRGAIRPYPPLSIGEDYHMVQGLLATTAALAIDAPATICYIVHGGNTCRKAHFERLFANATESFDGAAYDGMLDRLTTQMPIAGYLAMAT